MHDREQLRAMMIQNAAEINRLKRRIDETARRRSENEQLRQEWSQACEEFHTRYGELCIPGGLDPGFYGRILAGDPATIEVALCFLEVRPYFFRSGYHWKTILQKCKRAPMSGEQSERFARLLERYTEWKRLRSQSSKRGADVRRDLLPLLLRFYNLFPVKLSDGKFDGLVTVGDLYAVLCTALKLEPHSQPEKQKGVVRKPRRATLPSGRQVGVGAGIQCLASICMDPGRRLGDTRLDHRRGLPARRFICDCSRNDPTRAEQGLKWNGFATKPDSRRILTVADYATLQAL